MQLNDIKNTIKAILSNSPLGRVIAVVNVSPDDLRPFNAINVENVPDDLEHHVQVVLEGTDESIILCYPHGVRYEGKYLPFTTGIIANRIMWLNK